MRNPNYLPPYLLSNGISLSTLFPPKQHLSLSLLRLLCKPHLRGSVGPSMRFLLEFASCCGCAPPPTSSSSHYGEKRRSFGARRPTSRLPPSSRPRHVLKRRRLAGAAQWRPTLVSISEDNNDDEEVATRLEKQGKRRSDSSEALHYDYNSRRAGGSKIMTGFYPMPYMF